MAMFRRFLTGLARLSVCLALAFVTFAGQTAVSTEAAAQTSVRAYVINGKGSGTFKVGEAVAIAADPAPPGYQFARWIVLGGIAANPNAASTTVTANARSPYVIAIAQRMLVPSPDATYPLTVFYGTGSGSYKAGTVVDVSAPATRGTLVFSSWYDPFKVTADPKSATTKATIPLVRSYPCLSP